VPGWAGLILAVTGRIQFCVGLLMDSHYEKKGLLKYIFWAIWYPAIYWVLSALTTIVAVPIGLYNRGKTQHAVWSSPKRKVSEITSWIKQPAGNQKAAALSNPGTGLGFWRNSLEFLLTLIFWGSWVYLVIPLVSLLLWFVGIYLVIDRMAALGGYQALADQLGYYSAVVAFMAGAMGGWITWNVLHYGRNDRRGSQPGYVPSDEIRATLGLETDLVKQLRVSRDIALYFDQNNKPVIDHH
jgi:poly-beta-1,6-N-acetyl-D-glucosamine biosynthesis protein PgaD